MNQPRAYFLTFRTFGSWMPGDERGSTDRANNLHGEPFVPPQRGRLLSALDRRHGDAVTFSPAQRHLVGTRMAEIAAHYGWTIHAAYVGIDHVHVVLSAAEAPERVLNGLKSWLTRRMREQGGISKDARVWSRHGSTVYLWTDRDVTGACQYVAEGQSESDQFVHGPMDIA